MAIPNGARTIQVVGRIRDAVIAQMGTISAFYVYLDVFKTAAPLRDELRMAGCDIIDCSATANGKPGQVDLCIVARTLRTPAAEAVCIVTGDGDFAYVLSQLRLAQRITGLVYDANNTVSVSTALLEVANVTLPIALAGVVDRPENSEAQNVLPQGEESAVATDEPVLVPEAELTSNERHFIDAVHRSPDAENGGWKAGPCVGVLFRQLSQTNNAAFRAAKSSLLARGRLERRGNDDIIRESHMSGS